MNVDQDKIRRIDHRDYLTSTARLMWERQMSKGQILEILEQRNIAYGPTRFSRAELLEIVDRIGV